MKGLSRVLALHIAYLLTSAICFGQGHNYKLVDWEHNQDTTMSASLIDGLGGLAQPARLIIDGAHLKLFDGRLTIGTAGLWSTVPVYNFVDGFWVGQTFNAQYNNGALHRFNLESMVYYTTARKKVIWQATFTYQYHPSLMGKMKISAGQLSADYDTEEHLARLENSLYSLVAGRNYMKLYNKRYIEIRNSIYLLPGVRVFNSLSLQWRNHESNHTTYSFFHPDINQDNIPFNKRFRMMPANTALIGTFGFDLTVCKGCVYNPRNYEIVYSRIPSLQMNLTYGIPVGKDNRSRFAYIEANISQRFRLLKSHSFDYKIGCGIFLYKHNLWFPDFKHFGAYSLPSMRTFTNDGYFLIGYYKADTDRYWVKGSANYVAKELLLTRVQAFRKDFNEGFHSRYLWTPDIRNYTEWGYALGYKEFVRLGMFIGFKGIKYSNWGFSLSFPWLTGGY